MYYEKMYKFTEYWLDICIYCCIININKDVIVMKYT